MWRFKMDVLANYETSSDEEDRKKSEIQVNNEIEVLSLPKVPSS